MKKILFAAAICASLLACKKSEEGTVSCDCTINGVIWSDATKVQPDDTTSNPRAYHWEEGDMVVIVDRTKTEFSEFTLVSKEGNRAEFRGKALSDMSLYYVCCGFSKVDVQAYLAGTLNNVPVKYVPDSYRPVLFGVGRKEDFSLESIYPVLKLTLTGAAELRKMVFIGNGANDSTVMTIDRGLLLTPDKDTAVYFPVASHVSGDGFTVRLYDEFGTNVVTQKSYEDLDDWVGKIFSLPKTEDIYPYYENDTFYGNGMKITTGDSTSSVSAVWAPVNCGYDETHPCGLLYQWGRKYGQGYKGEIPAVDSTIKFNQGEGLLVHPDKTDTNGNKFYRCDSQWYVGEDLNTIWNEGKGEYDPCPDGWRVPSYDEMNALIGNAGAKGIGSGGWDKDRFGYWFNGTEKPVVDTGLFLPAAGYRTHFVGGAVDRNSYVGPLSKGHYWSSAPILTDAKTAYELYFVNSSAYVDQQTRGDGLSVRCVME